MEFRILGPLEVLSNGRVLELGGHKQRALLALLLIDANRVVSTDRLIDALWGDDPPGTGQKTLQAYVSRLRKVLGSGRLQTRAPGYALRVESDELDLMRFESLQAEEKLQEGLALWRGSPLGEFASEGFAQAEIARLDELHLACLEERVEQDLTAGRGFLVAVVNRVVEDDWTRRLRGALPPVVGCIVAESRVRPGRGRENRRCSDDARSPNAGPVVGPHGLRGLGTQRCMLERVRDGSRRRDRADAMDGAVVGARALRDGHGDRNRGQGEPEGDDDAARCDVHESLLRFGSPAAIHCPAGSVRPVASRLRGGYNGCGQLFQPTG